MKPKMTKQKNETILLKSNKLKAFLRFKNKARIACLLVLMICSSAFVGASCPSSASQSTAASFISYGFSGYPYCLGYSMVVGPISKNLYISTYLYSDNSYSAIAKFDSSNNPIWQYGFPFNAQIRGLKIDSNEQNAYIFVGGGLCDVIRLSTSDGSIVGQYSFPNILIYSSSYSLTIYEDNNGFYFGGYSTSDSILLCRYTFSTSIAECQTLPNVDTNFSHLMVSQNQFILIGGNNANTNFQMYKLTFSSTSVDWANKVVCSSGSCYTGISDMILSSDASTIYIFYSFGAFFNTYAFFTSFSVSTGSVIGALYKSSIPEYAIWSLALNSEYLICVTSGMVMIYKISTSTFQIKNTPNFYYGSSFDQSSGRFLLHGHDPSPNCSLIKFIPEVFNDLSVLTTSTATMSISTDATESLVADSGITLSAAVTVTVNSASYTSISVTYTKISSFTSDVYYQTADQSISVLESSTTSSSPTLTCSTSGSTEITYSISNYGASSAPSWISIDPSTGALTIASPSVDADTEYDFYINSAFSSSGGPLQKLIKLTVMNCEVSNCEKCSSSSGSTCEMCRSGFNLASGTCAAPQFGSSEEAKALGIFILVLIIATLFVVAALSLKNKTSMWSFWSMIGQIQMLILVFITRSVTSEDIRKILSTSNFTMNIYQYIYITNISFYDWIFSNVKFALTRSSLNGVVLDSDSSIYNLYPVMTCILVLGLLHLIMLLVGKQIMKISTDGKCTSFIKIVKWVLLKLYRIMTFGFYIRNAFLMCEFIMICSIYEIFQNNGNGAYHVVSLIFAYFMVLLYVAFTILVFYLSVSSYNAKNQGNSKLIELFWGLKDSKIYRLYMVSFIIRRAVYTLFFVGLTSLSSKVVFGIITAFQFFYLSYILIIRPFKEIVVNAIEVLNESILLLLIFILNFFPQSGNWTSAQTNVYKVFIVFNFILIFLFVCANGAYTFIKWVRERPSRADLKSEDGPNFVPNEEFPDRALKKREAQTDVPIQNHIYNLNENQDVERSRMNHPNNMC